jgi:hypothetical protein
MGQYGKPVYIRSDNGAKFTAAAVMHWLRDQNVDSTYIKPGSPWQNGTVESFNGNLRDERLNREWSVSLCEARIVTELLRSFYNASVRTARWTIGCQQQFARDAQDSINLPNSLPNWLQIRGAGQLVNILPVTGYRASRGRCA